MKRSLTRTLIAVAVAFAVYFIGINFFYATDESLLYIASVIAGGCYWIGSKE